MNIIYDFETSTSDFLGQILSFAFVVTDDQLNIIDTWKGTVKLNRTQIADPGAILTNKLNIDTLNESGKTEYDTAKFIQSQLDKIIATHGEATLIGFNSNQFDLQFLRNTLLRYGLNPYFKGKLHNIDVLHWIQSLAFENEEVYPWTTQNMNLFKPSISFSPSIRSNLKEFQPQRTQRTQRKDYFAAFPFFLLLCSLCSFALRCKKANSY